MYNKRAVKNRGVAQLVARLLWEQDVGSSSLFTPTIWEHSSAGRASALQAEGHRFEPCCSHQRQARNFPQVFCLSFFILYNCIEIIYF